VNLGHGFVDITIFETDVPPRFRLFFHNQRRQARSVPARSLGLSRRTPKRLKRVQLS
jgi:hypothetical protein